VRGGRNEEGEKRVAKLGKMLSYRRLGKEWECRGRGEEALMKGWRVRADIEVEWGLQNGSEAAVT